MLAEIGVISIIITAIIAAFLVELYTSPRKKLLILDLNHLLVARVYAPKLEQEHAYAKDYIDQADQLGNHYVWKRPGLDRFLEYCFQNFTVAVWSSAWPVNVEKTVEYIFTPEQRQQLLFKWSQQQCTRVDIDKPLFEKNLTYVWESYWRYNKTNTLVLDDSDEKMRNNPDVCVGITDVWAPWENNRVETFDEIIHWLEERKTIQ